MRKPVAPVMSWFPKKGERYGSKTMLRATYDASLAEGEFLI
jgi:hypothetical protein